MSDNNSAIYMTRIGAYASVLEAARNKYVELADAFDFKTLPPKGHFADVNAMLRELLSMFTADLSLYRCGRIDSLVSRFQRLVDDCTVECQGCGACLPGCHVIYYPFHAAMEAANDVIVAVSRKDRSSFLVASLAFIASTSLVLLSLYWYSVFREDLRFNVDVIAKSMVDGDAKNICGLDDVEKAGEFQWRWSLGPVTAFDFNMSEKEQLLLQLSINSYIPGQSMIVLVNERQVAVLNDIPMHAWNDPGFCVRIPFTSVSGKNHIRLMIGNWNGKDDKSWVPDPRPLGVKFFNFQIIKNTIPAKIARFADIARVD